LNEINATKLANPNLLTRDEESELWEAASIYFAKGASGDISAFVRGAKQDKTFLKLEFGYLMDNAKVRMMNLFPSSVP